MFYGTIRSFNANTGYGFIISDAIEGECLRSYYRCNRFKRLSVNSKSVGQF